MEDIGQKISDLLNSEDGLNQIRKMAEMFGFGSDDGSAPDLSSLGSMFGGGGESKASGNGQGFEDLGGLGGLGDLLKNVDMKQLLRIMSAFSNGGDDDNARLLLSLKPLLTCKRQKRVDEAITMMKLISLLPLLKESGILSSLFGTSAAEDK